MPRSKVGRVGAWLPGQDGEIATFSLSIALRGRKGRDEVEGGGHLSFDDHKGSRSGEMRSSPLLLM
jgi:hypothetical protein